MESPPFVEVQRETGVAQPEGIGPSEGPHGEASGRDDVASLGPDNANMRAETLSAQGNRPEDGSMGPPEPSMRGRAEPSKGKSRQLLGTREQWSREPSGSRAPSYGGDGSTAAAQITAIAERLSDLQAEVQRQDEEFDTLMNAVKERRIAVRRRLDEEANQVRLVMDSLEESGAALRAQTERREPRGSKGAEVLPTGATQWGTAGPERAAPAEPEDADGWHSRNRGEGSHIPGEPGSRASSPREMPGLEQRPKPRYPQLGLREPTGRMGPFGWLGPPQRERENTREVSPSATDYRSDVLHRYIVMIREKMSISPEAITEIKGIKIEPPELYDGRDDLVVWERWLDGLLNYFYFYRVVGSQLDHQRVMLAGTRLSGIAATWYTQEITGMTRAPRRWTFEEVITAMFKRFLTEVTAQKAVDAFYQVSFTKAKGALGFWNELVQAAERMLTPPDPGTMKRQFLNGLPHEMVEAIVKTRAISVELSSVEDIIDASRQVEASLHYLQQRRAAIPSGNQPGSKPNPVPGRTPMGQRFVRLRPKRPRPDRRPGEAAPPWKDRAREDRAQAGAHKPRMEPPKAVPRNGARGGEVICFTCGKAGHYSTACTQEQRKPEAARGNVRNFALRGGSPGNEPEGPQDDPAVESEEPVGEPPPDEVVEDDYIGHGDQYDSDDVFVLEELEEGEQDDGERIAGIRELEEEEILYALEERVGHVDDRPYRAHARKDRTGTRPIVAKEARQCLASYITINGVKAYTLFDSGSTPDLMSPDFARVTKVKTFRLDSPVPIQLGCVGSRSTITRGCRVMVDLGGMLVEDQYFDIANIDRYDVIVGTAFMYDRRIVLDVHQRTIQVGDGKGTTLQAMSPGEETEAVRLRAAKKGPPVKGVPKR
jgi:hypothetical protein